MTKEEIKTYGMRAAQSNPTQLVAITLELAARYLNDAMDSFSKEDIDSYLNQISKARACINELASSLDFRFEISAQLFEIYRYCNKSLVKQGINYDEEELTRIAGILGKLQASFETIASADKSGPVMGNSQQVYAGLTYSRNSLNENYGQGFESNRGYTV